MLVTLLMQCFQKKHAWSDAAQYLAEVSSLLDSVVVLAIEGYLAFYQERREQANQKASEAQSLIGPGTSAPTKEFLANLLMLLGRRSEALPLWKELFEEDVPGFDTGILLDCAARLQRADIILETRDRLRSEASTTGD